MTMSENSWPNFALVVLIALSFSACGGRSSVEGEILSRTNDPDSTVTSLVARADRNATVSSVYRVYLKSAGDGAPLELLRADKVDGLKVTWEDSTTLLIAMKCGRVFFFQNFYDDLSESGKLIKRVAVKLDAGRLCPE